MNHRLAKWLAPVLGLAVAVSGLNFGVPSTQANPNFVTGEILVKFKPGARGEAIAEAHRQNGSQIKEVIPGIDVQVVGVPAGQEQARVAAYERNPNVEFAEVNGFYQAIAAASDEYVGRQWQYNNTGQTGGRTDADIDAFKAWDLTMGNATVAIAILDTGIDQDHGDLSPQVARNINFTTSPDAEDRYGHGTHVAGSAAAVTNNGTGVAGTCPNCALYNVKVLGDDGGGAWSWIANGINWSADNGARVISMSLGGSTGSKTVETAINRAWNKGAIITAAAGNNGTASRTYPGYYAKVIAVAATDANDVKAGFSNYGSWVDVAAPGAAILSTAPNHPNTIWGSANTGGYGTISGTSMATPHVAGLAGLVWSTGACRNDNSCVRGRIESRADKISGTGKQWAYGRINAFASVSP